MNSESGRVWKLHKKASESKEIAAAAVYMPLSLHRFNRSVNIYIMFFTGLFTYILFAGYESLQFCG
jgi:hypothetical protein